MSANNAREVGSNMARQSPFSALIMKNNQIRSASAKPTKTSAQPKMEMNSTFFRPITSEM
ncbi:hypothetical protein D1872_308180 [compost metagenome]